MKLILILFSTNLLFGQGVVTSTAPIGSSVVYSLMSEVAADMLATDAGTYNSIVATNACPAGSCAETAFAKTFTIPANKFIASKVYQLNLSFLITTSVGNPNVTLKVKLGGTACYSTRSAGTWNGGTLSNLYQGVSFYLIGTAAPGAAVAIDCFTTGQGYSAGTFNWQNGSFGGTFATNSALALTVTILYSAATAANMTELRSISLIELN